ncbi:hypothetical protein [Rathayibacter sp. VKM Ac-2754]|uniref:hypothetical protein n=1 Tax=Rathayibacter sp. VKM Ac-2754 TaxID=2609251 RepID=UPI00135BEC1E|nr:hypothetical protein [Rathayibacter sp. VKM Ac-2754]MWV58950.1 hypothetical protein [Rathayibacter sp. VKM Ac-2754]
MTARQVLLDRDAIVDGLRELVRELRRRDAPARISIVGGAAIALTITAERRATVDVDGPMVPAEHIRAAARDVARRRGWRDDWINDAAAIFLPSGLGTRSAVWTILHDEGDVVVEVASPETLLAMKLHAAQHRGNREAEDLSALLAVCDVTSVSEAEELYAAHYPGDDLSERTSDLVDQLLRRPRAAITRPGAPDLSM